MPRALLQASLFCFLLWPAFCAPATLELVSVRRIWDRAPHSAFGNLIQFRGQWFCAFREGLGHMPKPGSEDDGKLRVIVSKDGEEWRSAAVIEEKGTDLRNANLSIAPGNRLMIVAGGSKYPGGIYNGRQPRVVFSRDGFRWTAPERVLEQGHWLWQVTWHRGRAYGVSKYGSPNKELPNNPRRQNLVTSTDGLHWETVTELRVPGGDETAVRFLPDRRMMGFMRRRVRSDRPDDAVIGVSNPPYKKWEWRPANCFVGGPNFIVLPGTVIIGGGRYYPNGDWKAPKMALGPISLTAYEPELVLPSGGDSSYPDFVFHDGLLWTMYYSSHEGKTAIYLAKVRVRK